MADDVIDMKITAGLSSEVTEAKSPCMAVWTLSGPFSLFSLWRRSAPQIFTFLCDDYSVPKFSLALSGKFVLQEAPPYLPKICSCCFLEEHRSMCNENLESTKFGEPALFITYL